MEDTTNAKYCTNCMLSILAPTEAPKMRTERVEELLHQNHPPLDVELSAFREVVDTTPAALEALDSKIAQARELLENLISVRQDVQSHFEDAKALLHPMRSIPNELLAKIFSYCIETSHHEDALDTLDPRAAPWLISGICRRWRNLAINSPQLWTHLLLDFDKQRGHITGRQCVYKVGLFTERSRGLPMIVYLGSAEEDVTDHPVLPCLEVSIPRWVYLQVDLPRTCLQCLSGNSFSKLRKLSFYPHMQSQWSLDLDVFQSARAPSLREFGVNTWTPLGAPLKQVSLPWAQLTCVYEILVDADGLGYFSQMTNVEELEVVLSKAYAPSVYAISLLKLRRLSIFEDKTAKPGYTSQFFSTLTIPSISELKLEFSNQEHLCLFPTLNASALKQLIKLDIICTTSVPDTNSNLLAFLSLTPRVEQLAIDDASMPVDLFVGLTFSESSDLASSRLPALRVLDVAQCACDNILAMDISPIFDMLQSRVTDLDENDFTQDVDIRRACLRKVQVPRWLYKEGCQRWKRLCGVLDVECVVAMNDDD